MEVLTPSQAAQIAISPLAAELSDATAIVVDLREATPDALQSLRALAVLPFVIVGIGASCSEVDVAVDDEDAARIVVDAANAHPITAVSLVLHLRATDGMDPTTALVAESSVYSMLQAGPEQATWLANRSPKPPRQDDDTRVRVTREDGQVHIALARPTVRNAVDALMQRELIDALATVGDDESVLLTGDGPVFSSGGDLDEFGTRVDPATAHLLRVSRSPARALLRVADRTTAVVQGSCQGAGVELPAFAAHLVADSATTFTLPEITLGLIPGAGGTVSIPRRIGRHRTAWMAITGQPIDAPTALEWGLVDDIDG